MLLGYQVWLPVAEVKKYYITLAINLSSSVLKPDSLSSFLLSDVILKQSERKKKRHLQYWSLICCINLISDEEFTNLVHNQLFFFPFLHLVLG